MKDETLEFLKLILHDDKNSFYRIAVRKNGKMKNSYYNKMELLRNDIEFDDKDTYISINGFCIKCGKRRFSRQINGVFVDLDCHDICGLSTPANILRINIDRTYMLLMDAVHNGDVFAPSIVVSSGRGLHLYYIYENSISVRKASGTENCKSLKCHRWIQSIIFDSIKNALLNNEDMLELDTSVKDITRISRLPGTINSHTATECTVLWKPDEPLYYTFADFGVDTYEYNERKKEEMKKNKKSNRNKSKSVHYKDNYYGLNALRVKQIEELQKMRNYMCDGCRENMMFHYYNAAVQIMDVVSAEAETRRINNLFLDNNGYPHPLRNSEIEAIIRGVRQNKGMSAVGMKSYVGYYKINNARFYSDINVKTDELENLPALPNKRQRESTEKKKNKAERDRKIISMAEAGVNHSEISKNVNVSLRTVQSVLKAAKKTRKYA